MVLEVVYSKGSEKLAEEIERRELERRFYALSDHLVFEEERSSNKKYENLKVKKGGKYFSGINDITR